MMNTGWRWRVSANEWKRKEGVEGEDGGGQGKGRKVSEAISQSRLPGSWIPFMVLKSVISYKGDGRNAL